MGQPVGLKLESNVEGNGVSAVGGRKESLARTRMLHSRVTVELLRVDGSEQSSRYPSSLSRPPQPHFGNHCLNGDGILQMPETIYLSLASEARKTRRIHEGRVFHDVPQAAQRVRARYGFGTLEQWSMGRAFLLGGLNEITGSVGGETKKSRDRSHMMKPTSKTNDHNLLLFHLPTKWLRLHEASLLGFGSLRTASTPRLPLAATPSFDNEREFPRTETSG